VQVKKSVDRWRWLGLTVAMTAALGLAACGRKGGLDPPPTAGLTTPTSYASRPSLGDENYGPASPSAGERARTATAAAAPASAPEPPPKKTFFLDFLLAK
jgi:predicted small lipoprotein YifL